MVAIKAHQAEQHINQPAKNIFAYLIYGMDEGRISETARRLAQNWSAKFGDGGEIIRIDERALSENPDIIAIELRSVSMFGGYSVIRVHLNNRIKPDMIKELVALEPENLLIIEAGNLKPSSAIRKLFETSKSAAAIPCYIDEQRDIARLIDQEIIQNGFRLSSPARKLLAQSLGADHGISRQELVKLTLYADGKPEISIEDIEAIIGDSSQLAYDQMIASIMSGNSTTALSQLDRLLASGQSSAGLLTILGRHLTRLYKTRAMMESGRSAKDAVLALRPPVHFKQRDSMIQQAASLDLAAVKKAIATVQETVSRSRQHSDMETTSIERMILVLSSIIRAQHRQ